MLLFKDIEKDNIIYIVESTPFVVLEMTVISKHQKDGVDRLRLSNSDLSFEIDYDTMSETVFIDKSEAEATVIKHISDEVNIYIDVLSDGAIKDYYDLDIIIEKFKKEFPEKFI